MLDEIIRYIQSQLDTCDSEDAEIIYQDLLDYLYKKSGTLDKRKEVFQEDIRLVIEEMGWNKHPNWKSSPRRAELKEFYEYWTESDRGKRPKMLFEKKPTWDLKKRIGRWLKNNNS